MSTQRHPVLLWPDADGVTAALVGTFTPAAARACTEAGALRQLKELLEWRAEHEPWEAEADFADPALLEVKVEVRPQYRRDQQVLPCPDTLWLRVPCITGRQENGLRVAAVPHLGLRFEYQEGSDPRALVAHYVKEALHGATPLELAGKLPPRDCRLGEITLRARPHRARHVSPEQRDDLKVLFTVAEPLLRDAGRQQQTSAAFGREALVRELAGKLTAEKSSLLLVGPPGVGKSTVLLQAVRAALPDVKAKAEDDDAPDDARELRRYRFWRGSAGRLIAGMRYLGEWEERCEQFIGQLSSLGGVFCAENLLELARLGGSGASDSVAAFLLPYIRRGELRVIAEASAEEVEACRRQLPGFVEVFQIVPVPAFTDAEAVAVLERLLAACATTRRVSVEGTVAAQAQRLFQRFQPGMVFPGAAAGFLRGLVEAAKPGGTLTTRDALAAFVKLTGLPGIFLRDDLPLTWETVRHAFAARVIGQPDAVGSAANVVVTLKAGLSDPGRPFGVLLFSGPTGVGKTELVKALADYCFGAAGAKDRLVRLDMSEYAGWGAAARLLNAPDGTPSPWIERVRRQPFCVLLLDEIEKAAPEVFDVLLGLLDEGRLTDRFGRVTSFRSAIVVLTSNLGAQAGRTMGFATDAGPDYEAEVARHFRPEFFNRLDAVVTFRPLAAADMAAIARKELADLAAREGFAAAGLRPEWSDDLVAAVAAAGYDPRYGARPLQRALDQMVSTPLARWRLAHPTLRDATLRLGVDSLRKLTVEVVAR
jgi:ATP-dependent Clp protease ATP-binding subunit ClpC